MKYLPRQNVSLRKRLMVGAAVFAVAAGVCVAPTFAESPTFEAQKLIVGLGDSFTSGVGNLPYEVRTDGAGNECYRSTSAYPLLAASAKHWVGINLACAGATTAALTGSYKGESSQVSQLVGRFPSDLYKPDYVVMTIGGNDVNALQTVVSSSNPNAIGSFDAGLKPLEANLVTALARIKAVAPKAHVLLLGYPNVFPVYPEIAGTCGVVSALVNFSVIADATSQLNATISRAADEGGATYVDVTAPFRGHDICSKSSYFFTPDFQSSLSRLAHPNSAGVQAMANSVVDAIDRLDAIDAKLAAERKSFHYEGQVLFPNLSVSDTPPEPSAPEAPAFPSQCADGTRAILCPSPPPLEPAKSSQADPVESSASSDGAVDATTTQSQRASNPESADAQAAVVSPEPPVSTAPASGVGLSSSSAGDLGSWLRAAQQQ